MATEEEEVIESYKGDINEFVDWVSGTSVFDREQSITGGIPVSGSSIRKLLQDRMIHPVYLHQNTTIGKYQLFSSRAAQELYDTNRQKYKDLMLGEFDGPSAYSIKTYLASKSSLNFSSTKEDETKNIIFYWKLEHLNAQGNSETAFDSFTITVDIYDIKDNRLSRNISSVNSNENGTYYGGEDKFSYAKSISVLPLLTTGYNKIVVSIESNSYGVKGPELSVEYTVIEFIFNEENFSPFNAIGESGTIFIQPTYKLSTNAVCTISAFIDGNPTSINGSTVSLGANFNIQYYNLAVGSHRLLMYLTAKIDETSFISNVICKNFSVKVSSTDNTNIYFNSIFNFENANDSQLDSYKQGIYNVTIEEFTTFLLKWGLYTRNNDLSYNVKFYLIDSNDIASGETAITVTSEMKPITTFSNVVVGKRHDPDLVYTPKSVLKKDTITGKYIPKNMQLGYTINDEPILHPVCGLRIEEFTFAKYISEDTGYVFKYDATGYQNGVNTNWAITKGTGYEEALSDVNFATTGVTWIDGNGWYENSFRTKGTGSFAKITNIPFSSYMSLKNNFAFEIEFMIEYLSNENDLLINIGNFIKIYPNRAILTKKDSQVEIIKTNFKAEERLHITFIRYSDDLNSPYKGLYMIMTNGIMERGSLAGRLQDYDVDNFIKIGGSETGIRVFGMRFYDKSLDWRSSYNNWIYDQDNKGQIILRNNVFNEVTNDIEKEKCSNLMDTILLVGDVEALIGTNESSDENVKNEKVSILLDSFTRISATDYTKDFSINNCLLRTHGQSNLNYPVLSMKLWSNKGMNDTDKPEIVLNVEQDYTKNRVNLYESNKAVPANKWVLQSNFADSSCAHCASFLRLWNKMTYNAVIDQEYKLRTPPQLFSTNKTVTPHDLNKSSCTNYERGLNDQGKQWKDYSNNAFPYELRQAPDSFPAMIFYKQNENDTWKFLGQYVMMDDKKSDYLYGERSMYHWNGADGTDPFVIKRENVPYSEKNPDGNKDLSSKYDKDSNRIWDNGNVIRIEVLETDTNEVNFKTAPSDSYWLDENKHIANNSFEIIYPDIDDLLENEANGKKTTVATVWAKWKEFADWLYQTRNNPTKFQREADEHLDLYGIAAYYFFCMMFGLVDSTNRNMQWKTYDGVHWRIEPWDMDIALGRNNTGVISYSPPMDRQTKSDGTDENINAFSGKGSVLWNNLEAWSEWTEEILPKVIRALYPQELAQRLSYNNVVTELDTNYSLKWPEYIYNQSQEFKYIYSGKYTSTNQPGFLSWLQGAGINYRHWWLETSMEYWYSRYGVGPFVQNHIKIGTQVKNYYDATTHPIGLRVNITPIRKGYFGYIYGESSAVADEIVQGFDSQGVILTGVQLNLKETLSNKVPLRICGISAMEKLDISELCSNLGELTFNEDSDIRELNIGAVRTGNNLSFVNKRTCNFNFGNSNISTRLKSLQKLDVTGEYGLLSTEIPITLTHFYGAASSFVNNGFKATGNNFIELVLPNSHNDREKNTISHLDSLKLTDCKWDNVTFYDSDNVSASTPVLVESGSTAITEDGEIKYLPDEYAYVYTGTIQETAASGLTINKIELLGNTCRYENSEHSKELILRWLKSDYTQAMNDKPSHLVLENVDWDNVSYADLMLLSDFYNKTVPNIKGIITLSSDETMGQERVQELQSKFGNNVFSIQSDGLIVDYRLEKTVISVDTDNTQFIDNTYVVQESAITSNDGLNLSISCVQFKLQVGGGNVDWEFIYDDDGIDDYVSNWIPEKQGIRYIALPHHSNVRIREITGTYGNRNYYLQIKESNSELVTSPYEFRISVLGHENDAVKFKINPVSHAFSIVKDSGSTEDVALVPTSENSYNLRLRSKTSYVKLVPNTSEGTSQIAPTLSVSTSLQNGTGEYIFTINGEQPTLQSKTIENGEIVLVIDNSLSSQMDDGTAFTYRLTIQANWGSRIITRYVNLIIQKDDVIIDSTVSSGRLLAALNNSLQDNKTVYYKSDLEEITALTLNSTIRLYFDTTNQNNSLFYYLTNCKSLSINTTPPATSRFTDKECRDIKNMSALEGITLVNVQGTNPSNVLEIHKNVRSVVTQSSNIGFKSIRSNNSERLTVSLDAPCSIFLEEVKGELNIANTSNITSIHIKYDNSLSYKINSVASSARWLSLIPSGNTLTNLYIDSEASCTVSNEQTEIYNLGQQQNLTVENFDTGTITIYGYHKYYMENIPSSLETSGVSFISHCTFNNDYYVLYNDPNNESQYKLYLKLRKWYQTHTTYLSGDIYGSLNLGWTHRTLSGFQNNAIGIENRMLDLSYNSGDTADICIDTVKASNVKTESQNIGSKNILEYFVGYKIIKLENTSVDPELNFTLDETKIYLGNPTSVTVTCSSNAGNKAELYISETSGLTSIDVTNITNIYTTVFGWNFSYNNLTTLKIGKSSDEEEITSESKGNIVTTGLGNVINYINTIGTVAIRGTINAETTVYLTAQQKNVLNGYFKAGGLVLKVGSALEGYDPQMKKVLTKLSISRPQQLKDYSWRTFWEHAYNVYSATAEGITEFNTIVSQIVYAPESIYMKKSDQSSDVKLNALNVNFNGSNPANEELFNNLKFLCLTNGKDHTSISVGNSDDSDNIIGESSGKVNSYKQLFYRSTPSGLIMFDYSIGFRKNNTCFTSNNTYTIVNGQFEIDSDAHPTPITYLAAESKIFSEPVTYFRTITNEFNDEIFAFQVCDMMKKKDENNVPYIQKWFQGDYNYNASDFMEQESEEEE